MNNRKYEYCSCGGTLVTSGFEDDFGYWDVCANCGKRKQNGHHFYNHYDGEDHEFFYGPGGQIETDWDDDDD